MHAQPAKTGFISEWTFLAPSFIVCIQRRLYYSSFCLLLFGVIELRLNPSWIHQITQVSEEERESSLFVWVFRMPQEDLIPQTMRLTRVFTLLRGAFDFFQCCAKLQDCISKLEASLALPPNSLQGLVMDDWISWPVINLGEWKGRDQADMSPLRTGLQAPNWFICPFLLIMKKGNGLVQRFYRGIWLRRSYLREAPSPGFILALQSHCSWINIQLWGFQKQFFFRAIKGQA